MKKRLLVGLIGCILVFSLAGCSSEAVQVNVSNSNNISSNQFAQFIDIGDDLVYDSATRIVYIEDYTYMSNMYIVHIMRQMDYHTNIIQKQTHLRRLNKR